MPKQTKFYYIAVRKNNGFNFVTKLDNSTRMAFWDENEKPRSFTKTMAEDICHGLMMNGFECFIVETMFYEAESHFLANGNE